MRILQRVRRKVSSRVGFSLLEVMIGLVIFALGMMLLLSMIVVSLESNSWSEKTTISAQMIREKIEQLKNTPVANLNSGEDVIDGFTRSWRVGGALGTPNLYNVEVAVKWQDAESRVYACTTHTMIHPK